MGCERYREILADLISPTLMSEEAGPPYYLMRQNVLTGNMDQVYSSMDLKEVYDARRKELLLGVSYSSPHLEVWSTQTDGFGFGVYGDDDSSGS